MRTKSARLQKFLSIDAMCDDKTRAVTDYIAAIKQEMRKAKISELLKSGDMEKAE
ncbi:MAG: hypothetical protein L6V93_20340 [Clostridiales bacterium]|nr:MAG: hypothetical protein L6V93_20340 [Clostridiales bacterium]